MLRPASWSLSLPQPVCTCALPLVCLTADLCINLLTRLALPPSALRFVRLRLCCVQVKDTKTGECYRADKLLEDFIDNALEKDREMGTARREELRVMAAQVRPACACCLLAPSACCLLSPPLSACCCLRLLSAVACAFCLLSCVCCHLRLARWRLSLAPAGFLCALPCVYACCLRLLPALLAPAICAPLG